MNVVSLFNGMNTGRQALENVGIKVDKYYSSEIKPYAIELTQHHFPDFCATHDSRHLDRDCITRPNDSSVGFSSLCVFKRDRWGQLCMLDVQYF